MSLLRSSPLTLRTRVLLTRALLATCTVGTAFSLLQILLFSYGRDQGIYAMVGAAVLDGGMPYRDAWDFKPPGIYLLYAASRALFGRAMWGIRVCEVAALLGTLVAYRRIAQRFFGGTTVATLGGCLAALVYAQLEFWHTGQPESFGGLFVAWALERSSVSWPRRSFDAVAATGSDGPGAALHAAHAGTGLQRAWLLAGMLYGFAGLLKPPLAGCALASAFFAAWSQPSTPGEVWKRQMLARLRPFLWMGAGGVLTVSACAGWFVMRGAFADLYETLFVFTPHYTRLGWEGAAWPGMLYLAMEEWLVTFSSVNAASILAALILPAFTQQERAGILHILAVVAMQLVGVAMQGKFFPYHYGACLPLGGLLAGLGAFKLWQRALDRGAVGVLLFGVFGWACFLGRTATRDTQSDFLDRCRHRMAFLTSPSAWSNSGALDALYSVADVSLPENRAVAEALTRYTRPDQSVFVWGFEPVIYDLAGRRPASHYLYDVPQRVLWGATAARASLMRDLERNRPAAVVVERRDVFPVVTGNDIDSRDTLREFPELASWLFSGYTLRETLGDFEIYVR